MTNTPSRQLDSATIAPDYLCIDDLLMLIDEPNRQVCQRILADHRPLFEQARGSTHNHQTWDGGYIDHITDGMNYARHLFAMTESLGRPLPFSLSDALLVFYLHDLEKPWRILVQADGQAINRSGLDTKAAFKAFREAKLDEYGLKLTPAQRNGLTYVEGEMQDYSSERRVMNELAAFCHMIDVWSARIGYDYPKQQDEWAGAGRFRTSARRHRAKNLTCVSLTGPDDAVSIAELVNLSNAYPGVEWALLYVPGKEGAPRNPTQAWRKEFFAAIGKGSFHSTAVHLCGKVAFNQLMDTSLPIELLEADRFQLNVNARGNDFTEDETVQIYDSALQYGQELILQVPRRNGGRSSSLPEAIALPVQASSQCPARRLEGARRFARSLGCTARVGKVPVRVCWRHWSTQCGGGTGTGRGTTPATLLGRHGNEPSDRQSI